MKTKSCHGYGALEYSSPFDSSRFSSLRLSTIWYSSTISQWRCSGLSSSQFQSTDGWSSILSTWSFLNSQNWKTWRTWGWVNGSERIQSRLSRVSSVSSFIPFFSCHLDGNNAVIECFSNAIVGWLTTDDSTFHSFDDASLIDTLTKQRLGKCRSCKLHETNIFILRISRIPSNFCYVYFYW